MKWSGIVLGAVLLLLVGAWLLLRQPLPEGEGGAEANREAEALAARVEAAVDVEAWERTRALRFALGSHRYLWDRDRELVRLRDGGREVLLDLHRVDGIAREGDQVLEGEARRGAIRAAYAAFLNDSFWLNPLAKLRDEGVTLRRVTTESGAALLVQYHQGGITPGDSYLWHLGPEGRPERWQLWVSIIPIGGVESTWEGWQRLSTGAWISTLHRWPVGATELSEVEGEASLEALLGASLGAEREPDPFAPLVAEARSAPPWEGWPEGFLPVRFPETEDSCAGRAVYVGLEGVLAVPAPEGPATAPPPSALSPGVAREVAALVRPRDVQEMFQDMAGAYNGPGGEPLFRWHLERTEHKPVLIFDRRISRERLLEALRGADEGWPLRVGGVDRFGGRRCAVALVEEPADLGAQAQNARYPARVDRSGALSAVGPDSAGAAGDRIAALGAPLPGEPEEGLHVLRLEAEEETSAASLLHALALSRRGQSRYGWLPLARVAPYCLPAVIGCGCVVGCARGVRLLDEADGVRMRFGDEEREGRVERWCRESSGQVRPRGAPGGSDCFDAYVLNDACGGGCVAREMPDCGRCEACDASCAGAEIDTTRRE